jgi:hypothetical protein
LIFDLGVKKPGESLPGVDDDERVEAIVKLANVMMEDCDDPKRIDNNSMEKTRVNQY